MTDEEQIQTNWMRLDPTWVIGTAIAVSGTKVTEAMREKMEVWRSLNTTPLVAGPEEMRRSKVFRYLREAGVFAMRSKDPSSQVGALILDSHNSVRAQGWNGAARGVSADEDCRFTRPEKYQWSVHAEQNAIANAARVGIPLEGCTMVVTHPPCMVCANMIVQVGIKQVVTYLPGKDFAQRWCQDLVRTRLLFAEAGVSIVFVDGESL